MANLRRYVPFNLIIWIIGLLILGAAAGPVIQATATEKQLASNVLLSAIPFILIFVAIVLTFIALISITASFLNYKISTQTYRPIELTIVAGIILGVVGMFQPWWFGGFRLGFYLLLLSTLAFILWSHIIPRGVHQGHLGSVSVAELEQNEAH
jgi:hypothetical protein